MQTFNRYLTYEEYLELGGELAENAFNELERAAQHYIDYYTFDRIPIFAELNVEIPQVVKDVMYEFIKRINAYNKTNTDNGTVTSYSNGVETFAYRVQDEATLRRGLKRVAVQWLPDYLTCREVKFDVREYIQRTYNLV